MDPNQIEQVTQAVLGRLRGLIPFTEPQLDPFAKKVLNQNVLRPVSGAVVGDTAATATNYGQFFVADRSYEVILVSGSHRAAGTDAGAVTLNIEKCASGVAPDSGVTLLATAFDLKATANTPQFGTLTTVKANLILKKGDRLILKDAGVLTAVSDACVTVLLLEI